MSFITNLSGRDTKVEDLILALSQFDPKDRVSVDGCSISSVQWNSHESVVEIEKEFGS